MKTIAVVVIHAERHLWSEAFVFLSRLTEQNDFLDVLSMFFFVQYHNFTVAHFPNCTGDEANKKQSLSLRNAVAHLFKKCVTDLTSPNPSPSPSPTTFEVFLSFFFFSFRLPLH